MTMSAVAGPSRDTLDLRTIVVDTAVVGHLDGSASFAFGHQSALAAVNGPTEVRIRDELTDRATLEISYVPLNGVAGISASSFSTSLHSALSSVILLHLHPRTLIQLHLQTTNHPSPSRLTPSLQSRLNRPLSHFTRRSIRPQRPHPDARMDASERATLINAAMLALVQAGIPCLATVCAVGVAVLPRRLALGLRRGGAKGSILLEEGDDDDDDDSPTIIVDPDSTEESLASSVHLFAFACSGHVVECDIPGEGEGEGEGAGDTDMTTHDHRAESPAEVSQSSSDAKLVLIDSAGKVDLDMQRRCIQVARQAALQIHTAMRKAVMDGLMGQD